MSVATKGLVLALAWAEAGGIQPPEKVSDDDDVYYYIRWRLKLEGETVSVVPW